MPIRYDGQAFMPRRGASPPIQMTGSVGRIACDPSSDVQDLIAAMSICVALTRPEVKRQVGMGSMLTTQNTISPYGVKRLARIHASLELKLDSYLKGEDEPKAPRRRTAKGRKR